MASSAPAYSTGAAIRSAPAEVNSAATPERAAGSAERSDQREPSAVLALLFILVAVAVPFSLAVIAGAGGGIAVAVVGVLAIGGCLYALTVALLRLMGDED